MPRAAANARRLTKELVKRAKPHDERYTIRDTDIPDLSLRVYPSGRKSYVLRVTFVNQAGAVKQAHHTLGDATGYADPEDARKAALALRQRYKDGEDVQATQRAARASAAVAEKTLADGLDAYLVARAAGARPMKASTAADMRGRMGHGLAELMGRPLKALSAETVVTWHRERKLTAPTRADCEARYLRAVWNWCREEWPALGLEPWPTARWKIQKEWSQPKRRNRRLTCDTAAAWLATAESWPQPRERALFLLLFYSGFRINEALTLRWADVDADRGRVALRDTKTREDVTLPLARQARDVLARLPRDTDWVFPAVLRKGERKGDVGPMPYPSKAIYRHVAESGVEWAPHDLRRTFASVGTAIGAPDAAVRRLTNHKIDARDAHDGYIGFEPGELAPHLQRIADALEGMARGALGAVIDLHPTAEPSARAAR